jgi:hypothetical protein
MTYKFAEQARTKAELEYANYRMLQDALLAEWMRISRRRQRNRRTCRSPGNAARRESELK